MESKKILFIATSPLYLEKGASLRMYELAKTLSKNYSLDIVTYSEGKYFKLPNTKIYRTPKFFKPNLKDGKPTLGKIILDSFMIIKSLKLIKQNNYDIIHCEDFEGALIGSIAHNFSKKSKLVYDLHNRIGDNLRLIRGMKLIKIICKRIEKKIIAKTDLIILNWRKYENEKIFKDKNKFTYYDKLDLKLEKYVLPKKRYFVYVGTMEKYQNLENFIKIFGKIKSDNILVLIGKKKRNLSKLIKNNKLTEKVFLTGKLPIAQASYLIKNSIGGIVPRTDGSSMKTIHYLMLNKPVIAAKTSSNDELIEEGINGLFYKDNQELESILKNTEKLDKISKKDFKIKKIITNNWNEKEFLKKYKINLYQKQP